MQSADRILAHVKGPAHHGYNFAAPRRCVLLTAELLLGFPVILITWTIGCLLWRTKPCREEDHLDSSRSQFGQEFRLHRPGLSMMYKPRPAGPLTVIRLHLGSDAEPDLHTPPPEISPQL